MKERFYIWLNTVFAGWAKVYASIVLTEISNHGGNVSLVDWRALVNGAVCSFIPIAINFFNPKDPRYGINKEKCIDDSNK